jgi:hypothetical protein
MQGGEEEPIDSGDASIHVYVLRAYALMSRRGDTRRVCAGEGAGADARLEGVPVRSGSPRLAVLARAYH